MKIKKYKASSLQEAMKYIRKDLGQDAVILNSKVVYTGGFFGLFQKKNIEVIAGIDDDPDKRTKKIARMETSVERIQEQNTESSTSNETVHLLMEEMRGLKKLIQNVPQSGERIYPDELAVFENTLKRQGISDEIRTKIMSSVVEAFYLNKKEMDVDHLWDVIKKEVKNELSSISFHGMSNKKYINVIGPTGVGKTTTLAKLAAEMKIKQGKSIAFITTDTYRIAAIEQLKTYANILNAPVEVCYNAEDFIKAKTKLHSYDVVFIDTAGRNFMEQQYVKDLEKVIDFHHDMETFLVFSLTAKYEDMESIFEQFSTIPIHQFIFTKYDETSTRGAMLNLIMKTRIGCGYITNGQDVPDDIQKMDREKFVEWLLR